MTGDGQGDVVCWLLECKLVSGLHEHSVCELRVGKCVLGQMRVMRGPYGFDEEVYVAEDELPDCYSKLCRQT